MDDLEMEAQKPWQKYYETHKKEHNERTAAYAKEHMRAIGVKFHVENDWDVLARLDSVPNKMQYIRQLIRDDIKRTGFQVPDSPAKQNFDAQQPMIDELNRQYTENVKRLQKERDDAMRMLGLDPETKKLIK